METSNDCNVQYQASIDTEYNEQNLIFVWKKMNIFVWKRIKKTYTKLTQT